jgi:DNA-binding transcriptional MerR regulator
LVTIGEFARLGGVSIKALRLYANLGLLRPAAIKPQSRYRLYSPAQLSTLHRIMLLKNAGVALAQIGGQLSRGDEPTLSKIRESLVSRAEQIQRQLSWVEAEIRAAHDNTGSIEPRVVIKRLPKFIVWSRRKPIDSYDQADLILQELGKQVPGSARLVSGTIWHDCGQRTKVIDCEAFGS